MGCGSWGFSVHLVIYTLTIHITITTITITAVAPIPMVATATLTHPEHVVITIVRLLTYVYERSSALSRIATLALIIPLPSSPPKSSGGSSYYNSFLPWYGYLTGHAAITMITNIGLNSLSLVFIQLLTSSSPSSSSNSILGEITPLNNFYNYNNNQNQNNNNNNNNNGPYQYMQPISTTTTATTQPLYAPEDVSLKEETM